MKQEAIKLELIEWLSGLDDAETIEYLKLVKDARVSREDWWSDLSDDVKAGIERGLKDIENNRVISHDDMKLKYSL